MICSRHGEWHSHHLQADTTTELDRVLVKTAYESVRGIGCVKLREKRVTSYERLSRILTPYVRQGTLITELEWTGLLVRDSEGLHESMQSMSAIVS